MLPYWNHFNNNIEKTIDELNRYYSIGNKINFATVLNTALYAYLQDENKGKKIENPFSEGANHFIELVQNKKNYYNFKLKQRDKISNYDPEGLIYDDYLLYNDMKNKKILMSLFSLLFIACNKHNLDISPNNFLSLIHCINEIDRNVRNHSGFKDKDKKRYQYSMAVRYDTNDLILEIVIIDPGGGFDESMKNQGYEYEDSVLEAIKLGVTSKSNWSLVETDAGKNSGVGLFLLNKISSCRENNLEIYTNGRIYSNGYGDDKLRLIGYRKLEINNRKYEPTIISVSISLRTFENMFDSAMVDIFSSETLVSTKSKSIHTLETDETLKVFNYMADLAMNWDNDKF